ncbi:MAG: cupin domain-containing protein [Flexilinea sp.]
MNIDQIGKFPIEGNVARESGELFKITESTSLKTVFGKQYPVKLDFFVSNDLVHMGMLTMPSGGYGSRMSEVNASNGDTCFYVLNGPITFFLPERKETFNIRNNETFFIPENTKYQIINYGDEVIKAIFTVAPQL